MFEISQIRCFLAVAEELHFSRAADKLNMTQPPLSRQIKLLEHHVGALLLDRTNRSVRLTAAGRSFLPEASRILRLAQEAATTARRVAKGEQGSLAIGFTATIGYGLLPELVRELRTRVPHISLTLKELVTTAQLEALDSGQLDLGLMRPHIEHHGLKSMSLSREGLMLAIPERDASLWPEHPDLQNLQGAPLLMYSPYEASYFYRLLHDCLDRLDVKPDVVEYVSQIHTMLALVSSGMGVALIPASAARLQFRGITLRHVRTAPPAPVELVASWRQDNDNPLLKVLRQEVLTMLSSG